ncbi:MAG TPA: hypothetical protein VMM92_03120 [Thermoanaerobaculia bacterium]|nr:hypothetical protein [Thermoanaerobaculia bacterium]
MTDVSTRRQPSDNLEELRSQLERELTRLGEVDSAEPRLFQAYLQHAQVLAWRGVADGHMGAPGKVLECLRVAQPFIDRHMPALPPAAVAAMEAYLLTQSLALAAEALATRRAEDRISDSRSKSERAILQVLAENRETFLRRGEIHGKLDPEDRPTGPRVGQILAELHEEGIVLRVHGRAQGNPNSAFYALSPRGVELCRNLGLIQGEEDFLPRPIREALEVACNPGSPSYRRHVALGVLATGSLGRPQKILILKVLFAKAKSNPSDLWVDEAMQQVVNASRIRSFQAKAAQDSRVILIPEPQEKLQAAGAAV